MFFVRTLVKSNKTNLILNFKHYENYIKKLFRYRLINY